MTWKIGQIVRNKCSGVFGVQAELGHFITIFELSKRFVDSDVMGKRFQGENKE